MYCLYLRPQWNTEIIHILMQRTPIGLKAIPQPFYQKCILKRGIGGRY